MLQGVQAKGDKIRGVFNPDHTENAAFFLQLIIVKGMRKERSHGNSTNRLGQAIKGPHGPFD
jgi:hypothetical protein